MILQLDDDLVARLVEGVRPAGQGGDVMSTDGRAAAFASAAWSTLIEPGDAVAGVVVGALGPDAALALLIEGASVDRWASTLSDALEDELQRSDLEAALERWRPRLSSGGVIAALSSAARVGCRLLVPSDVGWPAGLAALDVHAPVALWVRGEVGSLSGTASIAVVGSRDATSYGEHVAMEISAGLCDRGVAVVSGAAYGIDGMAHRAALASGGRTVAFLAGGLDRLYPAAHSDLLLRIAATGAIISELPCGSSPTKWRFLQRNRLIAAVTDATVVVEAGRRSGSLNTAGHAASIGRPLGAVPGPVTSATSAGCHRLLREYAATCVTSADEALELVRGAVPESTPLFDLPATRGPDGTRLLDALSRRTPRGPTELARLTGLAPRQVVAALGRLDLEGSARESPGGWLRT